MDDIRMLGVPKYVLYSIDKSSHYRNDESQKRHLFVYQQYDSIVPHVKTVADFPNEHQWLRPKNLLVKKSVFAFYHDYCPKNV